MTAQRATDEGRQHWLAERRRGIGGSDAAAILGVHPYKTAFGVWLEKSGHAKEPLQTKEMYWGIANEEAIARRYTEATGRKVWSPDQVMVHPEHPFIIGTPDRLVIGEKRGVEIKTAGAFVAHRWGAEGTDEIPREYIVQCAHYMAVTQFPVWDVVVLIGGNDDRLYCVRRDLDFEATLIDRIKSWWERYIVGGEKPPMDGSEDAADYLADRFPTDKAPRITAGPDANALAAHLEAVKATIAGHEATESELVNQLKEIVGDASGIDGNGWRASWTGGKAKQTVSHEKLAALLSDQLQAMGHGDLVNQALAAAAVEKTSPRAFRFSVGK